MSLLLEPHTGEVWFWLGQPLKTFVKNVSCAGWILQTIGFPFKVP